MRTGSTVCYVKEKKSAETEGGIINGEGLYDSAISDDRAQVPCRHSGCATGIESRGRRKGRK